MEQEVQNIINPEHETIGEIGVGLNEMVLKFQGDLYKGRFFYVNTNEEGEKIGSGDPDIFSTTTYIENADLSPIHSTIYFNRDLSEYYLTNSNKSNSGTWVKVLPTHLSLRQILSNATLKIGPLEIKTSKYESVPLSSIFDHFLPSSLKSRFLSLSSLLSCSVEGLSLSDNEKSELISCIELLRSLPESISCFQLTYLDETIELTPRGLTLGPDRSSDIQVPIISPITITYKHPTYTINLPTDLPVYYKLNNSDEYKLQSGEIIKLGKIELQACRFNVGRWSHQGKRQSMEDADVVIHNLFIYEDLPALFFAVYDGHGGSLCSEFLRKVLHDKFREKVLKSPGRLSDVLNTLKSCIITTFEEVDQDFASHYGDQSRTSGSAAIICIVFGDRIITVNLGDSRAVLCRKGQAIDLSVDHKPTSSDEYMRIINCGGNVMLGRIDSKLAVSRAFGDFEYKGRPQGNLVEIRPDITQIFMDPGEDEFLVLGCDGLFEAYTSQELVDVVRKRLAEMPFTEQNPSRVIREIINEAVFEGKTNDNVTALLVNLSSSICV